jgi:hypothetical protein
MLSSVPMRPLPVNSAASSNQSLLDPPHRYFKNRLHKLAEVEQFDSAAPNFREENLRTIKKRSF